MPTSRHSMNTYRYRIDDHWEVQAGRTDADNDRLSLKVARANDWWFHVSGQPGSHVILTVPPVEDPSRDVLKQAALFFTNPNCNKVCKFKIFWPIDINCF